MLATRYPLPALTGIRGVAAVWVVLFHVGQGVPGYTLSTTLQRFTLTAEGFRGVDLFFILSGFIMMYTHALDFTIISQKAVLRFAAMRCVRIYPAHLATLLMILCIVVALPNYVTFTRVYAASGHYSVYTLLGFVQEATLTQRWLLVPDMGIWNGVTWSLSVELLAYSTLPPLAFWLSSTNSRAFCISLAFGSIAVMLTVIWAAGNNGSSTHHLGLARGLLGFLAGAAMCRFVALTNASGRQASWTAFITVVLTIILIERGYGLFAPFAFLVLIGALAYQAGLVNALLSSAPAMFLGKISYSLYLVHFTPLLVMTYHYEVQGLYASWGDIVVYLAGVVCLATVMHFAVERPVQRLARARTRAFVTMA